MSTYMQGGRVDFSQIQAALRTDLIKLLEKCPGTKALVLDTTLDGPLGSIAKYASLREYSVIKMFPLRPLKLPEVDVQHVIFFTRPKLQLMDHISHNIYHDCKTKGGTNKKYHVVFVPKQSQLCIDRFNNVVRGSITLIEELACEFFPLDADVVSMEIGDAFREFTLENDPTHLYNAARAILFLQSFYGQIPKVWGKGAAAKQVWDLVTRLQREKTNNSLEKPKNEASKIDQIILIDRNIDLITPLATQLTYEGLIDEIFGIKDSIAVFPIDNFLTSEERTSESLSEDKKKCLLDSADRLFAELRDKNFNAVGAYLSQQAKSISVQLDNSKERSVQEMKLYVQRLPQLLVKKRALGQHTAIAESVKDATDGYDFLDTLQTEQEFLNCIEVDKVSPYIEAMIAQAKPLIRVLRLICLQCLTSSGLKPKILEYYKREIVQVYGLESLLAIAKLERVGLLKTQTGSRNYTVLRKALHLTMEDTSEVSPTDISYVHSVYAPLSVRLCELLTKKGGWKQLQDVLGLLPGPTVDESPVVGAGRENGGDAGMVVLVFFIGGCTFAEISALRFLAQREDANVEFVVATTKMINGSTFLQSIVQA